MVFSWINREANLPAHYLAKWVPNNRWQGFVSPYPDQFVNVVKKDTLNEQSCLAFQKKEKKRKEKSIGFMCGSGS